MSIRQVEFARPPEVSSRKALVHSLLVVVNPEHDSLTHRALASLQASLPSGLHEVADLHAERFDPVFTREDRLAYQNGSGFPADVLREHERLDRATDIVFVFPTYWWSMPALLKGWVDRVLVNGWAFDWDPAVGSRPLLGRFRAHALPIAATSAGVWDRHGYEAAFRTQFEHGLLDYCGIRRGTVAFAHYSEDSAQGPENADAAARKIAANILGTKDEMSHQVRAVDEQGAPNAS